MSIRKTEFGEPVPTNIVFGSWCYPALLRRERDAPRFAIDRHFDTVRRLVETVCVQRGDGPVRTEFTFGKDQVARCLVRRRPGVAHADHL